jgi:hypothetical protein
MKGVAFDEGVNLAIFAMAIIFLGILFLISGIDISTIIYIGTDFIVKVGQGLAGIVGQILSGL